MRCFSGSQNAPVERGGGPDSYVLTHGSTEADNDRSDAPAVYE
jgi:hypothetical protein